MDVLWYIISCKYFKVCSDEGCERQRVTALTLSSFLLEIRYRGEDENLTFILILGILRFEERSKKEVAQDRNKSMFLLAVLNLRA